jgi:pimeloyl-ACP methyl ester carboxylesterase
MALSSRNLWTALAVLCVLAAPAPDVSGLQTIEPATCPVLRLAPSIDTLIVRCARVTVPQSRTATAAELVPVELTVVVFARRETPFNVPPLLYLSGGPGESAIDDVAGSFLDTETGDMLVRQRPIIAFDQRGFAGFDRQATPWLGGLRTADADTISLDVAQLLPLLRAVSTSLESRGIVLRNFNTVEAAHDAVDVLRLLGFSNAIVFGSSYGTRVAFQMLRAQPDMVTAAILDGVVPPQATAAFHLDSVNDFRRRAVQRLVEDCAADSQCIAMNPHIATDWNELAEPNAIVAMDDANSEQEAYLPGADVLAALGGFFVYESYRNAAPTLLSALARGRLPASGRIAIGPAAQRLARGASTIPDFGLGYLSVVCADAPMGIPQYGGVAVCDALGVPFGGRTHVAPVSSTVPTLLLSARYDGSSPPEWTEAAARTLRAAQVVHVPGTGHVTHAQPYSRACIARVIEAFVADPRHGADHACLDTLRLPAFVAPARSADGTPDGASRPDPDIRQESR